MVGTDHQLRTRLTVNRLLKLINGMSKEEQFKLLRQILDGDIDSYLPELVSKLPYEQQVSLLQQLDEISPEERPIKTIHLDEEAAFMRGHKRKSCLIAVSYSILDQNYRGYILDISSLGAFIETRMSFPIGLEMEISFTLEDAKESFNLAAEVVWQGRYGIGVKFKNLSSAQEKIISSFVEDVEEI